MKVKIALLLCLMGAALFTGAEALRSLRRQPSAAFPEEVYASFARNADSAVYFLRREGDYVADRAMVEAGLPVRSRLELLQLLEDLGS